MDPKAHLAPAERAMATRAMTVRVSGRSHGKDSVAAWAMALDAAAQARLRAMLPVVAASDTMAGSRDGMAVSGVVAASDTMAGSRDGMAVSGDGDEGSVGWDAGLCSSDMH